MKIEEVIEKLEWMLTDIKNNGSYQAKFYPEIIEDTLEYLKSVQYTEE